MNELLRLILDTQETEEEVHERFQSREYGYPYRNERIPQAEQALHQRLREMGEAALPLLLEGLAEPAFDARDAIAAFPHLGPAAIQPLLELLERGTPHEASCQSALRALHPPAALILAHIEAGHTNVAEVMGWAPDLQQTLPRLFELLREGNPAQRPAAALAIASAAHSLRAEHASALGEAVKNADPRISEPAASALEVLGPNALGAADALAHALNSNSPRVRRAAATTLGMLALEDPTPLVARISDPDEWVRQDAAIALVQQRCIAALPALIEHIEHVHTRRPERHLLNALVQLAGEAAAPHLVRWLHPSCADRSDIIFALSHLDAPEGVRALTPLLTDEKLREHAASALASIWERVQARLDGDDLAAAEALAGGHAPTRGLLLRCAEEGPEELRRIALAVTTVDRDHAHTQNDDTSSSFGLPDVETAARSFATRLNGSSDDQAHLRALKHLGAAARCVVPDIAATCLRPDVPPWVQRDAIVALGDIGGEDAERELTELAGSAVDPLRTAAVPALARLATPRAALALQKLLSDPCSRADAAHALARLPEAATAPLTDLLADAHAIAAWEGPDAIADALLRLVPSDPLTWACCTIKAVLRAPEHHRVPYNVLGTLGRLGPQARPAVALLQDLLVANPETRDASEISRIIQDSMVDTQTLLDGITASLQEDSPSTHDLARFGPLLRPAVPAIDSWLRRMLKRTYYNLDRNTHALLAVLGDIGGAEAAAVLLESWTRHPEHRRVVAFALGRVIWQLHRDNEPMPDHPQGQLAERALERILHDHGPTLLRAELAFAHTFARSFHHYGISHRA